MDLADRLLAGFRQLQDGLLLSRTAYRLRLCAYHDSCCLNFDACLRNNRDDKFLHLIQRLLNMLFRDHTATSRIMDCFK